MNPLLLRVVFLVSLAVVAAGLRWLWRHPRGGTERPPSRRGRRRVRLPTLPDPTSCDEAPVALLRMGKDLRRPWRSPRERRAALDWYRLAAARGSREAHLRLGLCHMTGDGVRENRREAARWFRGGWELGCAEAAYLLAALARGGAGTGPDRGEVTRWLEEAARLGHGAARRELLDGEAGEM